MKIPAVLVLAALTFCGGALGQDLSKLTGTIYVEAASHSSGGKLFGCGLNYQTIIRDHAYRQGRLVAVAGSVNLNLVDENRAVAMLLKVGVQDVLFGQPAVVEPPEFSYVTSRNGSTAQSVIAAQLSDTPGYKAFVIRVDQKSGKVITDILDGGPINIAFNRKPGGVDVAAPLDLSVASVNATDNGLEPVRSNKALQEFSACFSTLAGRLR